MTFDPSNPYSAPQEASPAPVVTGSLAQSARMRHLKSARWFLIIVGVINIGMGAFQLLTLKEQVATLRQQGADPVLLQEAEDKAKLMLYGIIALGVTFVVLGALVQMFPVPATVLGLVLYVGMTVVNLIWMQGNVPPTFYVLRILFIVLLAKAVQAAWAYQKESREPANFAGGMYG